MQGKVLSLERHGINMRVLEVKDNEAGQRLDKLLIKYLNKAPKSFIYKMLRKKNITLNGKKADGSELVVKTDRIKFFLSEETLNKFSEVTVSNVEGKLDIIYEDDNILVMNKPAGLLSQKAQKDDISLVEHLISYLLSSGQIQMEELKSFHPGICNRLDRNTSGIVIGGKSLIGLQTMGTLLKSRDLDKYYQCIVKGCIDKSQMIEGYLVKNKNRNKVTITTEPVEDADYIKTEYEPLLYNEEYTLLKVKLITGRSHQIRAHLHSIGHSIIGDGKYGDVLTNKYMRKRYQLRHQLLHSYELHFSTIEGPLSNISNETFIAPLPDYFLELKKALF